MSARILRAIDLSVSGTGADIFKTGLCEFISHTHTHIHRFERGSARPALPGRLINAYNSIPIVRIQS